MSFVIPNVIGEGTYGCVHKPSLKCKDAPTISYTNKVSKVLSEVEADIELSEYDKVKNADNKEDYYLGVPNICDIDNRSVTNLKAIQKCKIGSDVLRKLNNNDYKLLIMEDGGSNLEEFSNKMKTWVINEENRQKCELFLLESLRIFKGLLVFKQHGLIHHDLKPQNIVYNEATNRLNLIDFGLMTSRKKLVKSAKESSYDFSLFHWSYPWEMEYLNKRDFNNIAYSIKKQQDKVELINGEIEKKSGHYYENSKNFFFYSMDIYSTLTEYRESCVSYISGYDRTLKDNFHQLGYENFLNKCTDSIDVFGLGIALNYWFHIAKRHLSTELADDLKELYSNMVSAELKFRPSIDELLTSLESILEKNGLLTKYKKVIVDNIVVDAKNEMVDAKPIETESTIFNKIQKPNRDIINSPTPLPCPPDMVKNKRGKCVKIKIDKMIAPCPPNKVRNPRTRRCIKKCKPGYIRNENLKCVKNKTRKSP